MNIRGGVNKQAESLAHLSNHDFICLTETWLTANDVPETFPVHTYFSACRAVSDKQAHHSGGVGVFVSDCVSDRVEFMEAADDASYLWLKLKDIVLGCPEVFVTCLKREFKKITPTPTCPYERLQSDVLKYQGRGAQILLCGDFNARTTEQPDFLRMAELQPFLPNTPDDDDLPDDIPHRRNCNQGTPGSQNWGSELLEFCQQANLFILNGRTPGD